MRIDENYKNKQTNKTSKSYKNSLAEIYLLKELSIICALRRGCRFWDFL